MRQVYENLCIIVVISPLPLSSQNFDILHFVICGEKKQPKNTAKMVSNVGNNNFLRIFQDVLC